MTNNNNTCIINVLIISSIFIIISNKSSSLEINNNNNNKKSDYNLINNYSNNGQEKDSTHQKDPLQLQSSSSESDSRQLTLKSNQFTINNNIELNTYKISPKPCSVIEEDSLTLLSGTCMFVWECLESEGKHLGMCIDGFMFGSCCSHSNEENSIITEVVTESDSTSFVTSSTSSTTVPGAGTGNMTSTEKPIVSIEKWPTTTTTMSTPSVLLPWITNTNVDLTTKKPPYIWSTKIPIHWSSISSSTTDDTSTIKNWSSTSTSTMTSTTTTPPPESSTTTTEKFQFPTSTTEPTIENPRPSTMYVNLETTTTTVLPDVILEDDIDCGSPTLHPQMRIVGGKEASFASFPWIVSVRRSSFFGFSSTHRCGGALLNSNWIATAGHCVDDLLTSQIKIRLGEWDFSSTNEKFVHIESNIKKKIVHPSYNFFTYENDLALLQLEKPIKFSPHISPICLPGNNDLLIGENATVAGWGRLSENGQLPSRLQHVIVPIISNSKCRELFLKSNRIEHIPDIFLCAGYEKGGQDSCQGDSGGPLQVRGRDGKYFLGGIISWGIGCAEPNMPGVCTRVSKFRDWILNNVT